MGNAQMINDKYWIWLQNALGAGKPISALIEYFGGAKQIYEAGEAEWRMCPELTPKAVERLLLTSLNDSHEAIYSCRENGWKIITYDDFSYPQRLRDIPDPPCVLYVDGELPDIDSLISIGIVGTRKASDYAIKATTVMARELASKGAVIVSGGALGVDSAAHTGALTAGGKTIAVLGCGLGTNYLSENKPLRNAVKNNGALVTEYPPFSKATKYTFPLRNRIISGLSLGVLVAEAGTKSGSLITARYAAEQGRDVFAIPCSILEKEYSGTNKLIEDGATVATSPAVILSCYSERFKVKTEDMKSPAVIAEETEDKSANVSKKEKSTSFEHNAESRKRRGENQKAASRLSREELAVYSSLSEDFTHINEIAEKADMPVQSVISVLTVLEINGLVQSAGGKRYKLS